MDLDQLRHDGYTVAEQVVGPELVDAVVAAITSTSRRPPAMLPLWGHQALWDVRQHPPVHARLRGRLRPGRAVGVAGPRLDQAHPEPARCRSTGTRDPAERRARASAGRRRPDRRARGRRRLPLRARALPRPRGLARAPSRRPDWDIDLEGHVPTPVPGPRRRPDRLRRDAAPRHRGQRRRRPAPRAVRDDDASRRAGAARGGPRRALQEGRSPSAVRGHRRAVAAGHAHARSGGACSASTRGPPQPVGHEPPLARVAPRRAEVPERVVEHAPAPVAPRPDQRAAVGATRDHVALRAPAERVELLADRRTTAAS